jgi:hypothetical protein
MNTTNKTTTTKNKEDVKNMKDNFALIRVSFEPIFIVSLLGHVLIWNVFSIFFVLVLFLFYMCACVFLTSVKIVNTADPQWATRRVIRIVST